MSLFQAGGVKIAGRRVPLSVLAVLAAVGAALLVVRQMRRTQSAVSLGMPYGFYEPGGYQVGLDSLNDALRRIDDKLNNGETPSPPPAPAPAPVPVGRLGTSADYAPGGEKLLPTGGGAGYSPVGPVESTIGPIQSTPTSWFLVIR